MSVPCEWGQRGPPFTIQECNTQVYGVQYIQQVSLKNTAYRCGISANFTQYLRRVKGNSAQGIYQPTTIM
ncbi:hypothetical protein E2C01_060069 [Portunus trituberculatus]|uniref:Uncharacterized protein n=1 Tax=Portunus trituberculatus TaxID=210409 RepID=A0A5B7H011_PORTR|nr:hypothetical protein [Portunus trituberculatus]